MDHLLQHFFYGRPLKILSAPAVILKLYSLSSSKFGLTFNISVYQIALIDYAVGFQLEKALLLNQLNCADDYGIGEIKQHIASMESSLGTLNQQEKKYSDELDAALLQYTELQQQAADMDAIELDTACHTIRSDKERETAQRLQAAYGKKVDSGMLVQSRMDAAEMVGETTEPVSIRQSLKHLQGQQNSQSHKIEHSRER